MKVKHSLRKQFTIIFSVLLLATIILCWGLSSTLLEDYYLLEKKKVIMNTYEKMNVAVEKNTITTQDFNMEMQRHCGKYNIALIVLDIYGRPIISSNFDADLLRRQLEDQWFGGNSIEVEETAEDDSYFISYNTDKRTKTDYIEMWGILDNGNLFLIRSPLESVTESARIANLFLLYVGLVVSLLSAVIVWIISRKMTQPIYKLTNISAKMANLDFSEKYVGTGNNEVALLGQHFNVMSDALEQAISDLKTANNELRRDIARKEEIDEMRKEFLSNVSHELKTPIALIQGYAEGLKEGINDDDFDKDFYCDVIVDEAQKMNQMVQKLLNLNQLEFGQDVVTLEHFDIISLIRNYVQSAEILIQQHEAKVHINSDAQVLVWADEYKVEEVFNNYFMNALNHLDGDRLIDIKVIKNDSKVRISVFNSGNPIPEESVDRVWEKFYKADKARTRAYGGSGVGLSIVKAIMESMNQKYGLINYENGVEFWFELDAQ